MQGGGKAGKPSFFRLREAGQPGTFCHPRLCWRALVFLVCGFCCSAVWYVNRVVRNHGTRLPHVGPRGMHFHRAHVHLEAFENSQLQREVPTTKGIPKVIHQTWKSKSIPGWAKLPMRSWKRRNPGYKFILYDDNEIEEYVEKHYPDIMFAFQQMKPVQKADVFRYVVIYNEGGVYADIDTWCSIPVQNWTAFASKMWPDAASSEKISNDVDFIVGFEAVQKKPGWEKYYAAEFQLCQWTFAAAPKHLLLDKVLKRIIRYYKANNQLRSKSIIKSTGPGIWSYALSDAMKEDYSVAFGTGVFDKESLTHRGARAQSVLILPTCSFGRPYGGIGSAQGVMVWHGFQGSWKKKKKRFSSNRNGPLDHWNSSILNKIFGPGGNESKV